MASFSQEEFVKIINEANDSGDLISSDHFESFSDSVEQRLSSLINWKTKVVVVVCPSAEKCLNTMALLKKLGCHSKIGKLFSRHMKVEQQAEFLKSYKPRISVGTPNRITKLIQGGLFADLDILAFDTSLDAKARNVLQIRETRIDVLNLLRLQKDRLEKNKTRIVLF